MSFKTKFIVCNILWTILSACLTILWKTEEREKKENLEWVFELTRKKMKRDKIVQDMFDDRVIRYNAYEKYVDERNKN
jgi:hypothetical protein